MYIVMAAFDSLEPSDCGLVCCSRAAADHARVGGCAQCGSFRVKGAEEDKPLMTCPCKGAAYCSKDCQRLHWRSTHKAVCSSRKKA